MNKHKIKTNKIQYKINQELNISSMKALLQLQLNNNMEIIKIECEICKLKQECNSAKHAKSHDLIIIFKFCCNTHYDIIISSDHLF